MASTPDSLAVTVTVRAVDEGTGGLGATDSVSVQRELRDDRPGPCQSYLADGPRGSLGHHHPLEPQRLPTPATSPSPRSGDLSFRQVPDYDKPRRLRRRTTSTTSRCGRPTAGSTAISRSSVTVTDVNEAPTITTTSTSATALRQDENQTPRLYTYRATDPEGGTRLRWDGGWRRTGASSRLTAGASSHSGIRPITKTAGPTPMATTWGLCTMATTSMRWRSRPDDEGAAERLTCPSTVTVREVNEGTGDHGAREPPSPFSENSRPPPSILASPTPPTDPEDPSAMITRWSLSGSDAGDFTITEKRRTLHSGTCRTTTSPPTPRRRTPFYNISVRASGRPASTAISRSSVTVTGVNEAPTITTTSTSATALRQDENQTSAPVHLPGDGSGGRTRSAVDGGWRRTGASSGLTAAGGLAFRDPPNYEDTRGRLQMATAWGPTPGATTSTRWRSRPAMGRTATHLPSR